MTNPSATFHLFPRWAGRTAGLKAGRLARPIAEKNHPDRPKSADLHVHTNYSDGSFSPAEVVERATALGLTHIAITDHDEVGGIPEAVAAARNGPVEVVPGVEISTRLEHAEIHIIGLFITPECGTLGEFLRERSAERKTRVYAMTGKLRDLGVALEPEDVFAVADKGIAGRLHVAEALLRKGMVGSLQEAFYRYIGDEGPACVARQAISPAEVVGHIRSAGGVPILAHPGLSNCDELIPALVQAGIMGIEVYYPAQSAAEERFYLGIAEKNGLLVSGGSDCHGQYKNEIMLGRIRIAPEQVERLREAAQSVRKSAG